MKTTIFIFSLASMALSPSLIWASEHYMEMSWQDLEVLEKGDAEAQYNCGMSWKNTHDVINSRELAFKFFEKAAEKGYAPAQYELGLAFGSYRIGERGVEPPNSEKSVAWLNKAIEQKYAPAQVALGNFYCTFWKPEIRGKAFPLWKAAAEQGETNGLYRLRLYYGSGEDKNVDVENIYDWLKKSAENGRAGAQLQLGWCYERGVGFPKDIKKALEWYERGAETSDPHLQHGFASRFLHGDEWMAKDEARYVKWLTKSAEHRFPNARAQYDLVVYYASKGDEEETVKAVERLKKSAERDSGGDRMVAPWGRGLAFDF